MLFDIVSRANTLFKTTVSSYAEILYEFTCEYQVEKNNLPSVEALITFVDDKPEQDKLNVCFSAGTDSVYAVSGDSATWTDSYQEFVNVVDDNIKVFIKIQKGNYNDVLNVYKLDAFSKFLEGLNIEEHFTNFSKLFINYGGHVIFHLMDTNGSLKTGGIAFSENDIQWDSPSYRDVQFKYYEDASLFLDRTKICLIPSDFAIYEPVEGKGFDYIITLFEKLCRTLSFVYLANTSNIIDGKAILQFDPALKGAEYSLDELADNKVVPQICDWAFKDDNSTEKASIARKIINVY